MADVSRDHPDGLPLYEVFDARGREWLDEIVQVFNDGRYTELRDAFLADEAAIHDSSGDD